MSAFEKVEMQIPTLVGRCTLIFIRYLFECYLSFIFYDFESMAFLIINTVITHHKLTLISSICSGARSCDHFDVTMHHSKMMHGHVTVHHCNDARSTTDRFIIR